jgi:hypothetical protein
MFNRTHVPSDMRLFLSAATLACAAGLGVAAPGQAASLEGEPGIPVVEVTVDSTHITAPTVLSPGFTTFHSISTHPGTDSMAVVRLNRGVTYQQIFRYARHGNLAAIFRHVTGKGGIAYGGPHNGRSWTTNLHRGRHLFVDDEANLFAKLQVTGHRHSAPRPHTDGTITFHNSTFTLPRPFHDGTWRLHNDDTIQHEIGLVRIHGGHTRADVEHVLATGTHPSCSNRRQPSTSSGRAETLGYTCADSRASMSSSTTCPCTKGPPTARSQDSRTFTSLPRWRPCGQSRHRAAARGTRSIDDLWWVTARPHRERRTSCEHLLCLSRGMQV